MRSAQTFLGLVASASLSLTPAYADSHGRPTVAPPHVQPPHVQAPKTTGKPTVTSRPSSTTSPTTTTLNPIAQKISSHPQLASKVNALLPAATTLKTTSAAKPARIARRLRRSRSRR